MRSGWRWGRRRGWSRRLIMLCAVTVIAACGDGGGGGDLAIVDRWMRAGEDLRTGVTVYNRELPPQFSDLLNPDADEETPAEDLISLPVHPDGELLGSFHLRSADGVHQIWVIYDVPEDDIPAWETVADQLDRGAWQVIAGQGNPSASFVRFQTTRGSGVEGTAVIQPRPSSATFDLTASRDGDERTFELPRAAPAPLLEAELDGLEVRRVDPGAAAQAGLAEGDVISGVNGQSVETADALDRALLDMAESGTRQSSVVYLLEITPPFGPRDPGFVMPPGRPLPDDFPAAFVASDDLTLLDYSWATEAQGSVYQAQFVGTASTSDLAEQLRASIEGAGWTVTADQAEGFATILEFEDADGRYMGNAAVDVFALDDSLTGLVVRVQAEGGGGS